MLPRVVASECLRTGWRVSRQHPLPLILGWALAAGAVVLSVFLLPANLSLGLQLGAIVGAPALLWTQLIVLRVLAPTEPKRPRMAGKLKDWLSAFAASAAVPTLFRTATWWIWAAVPLTGGLMYGLYAWGFGNMFASGRMDLFISAVLFSNAGFMISCGLFFAPLCAMQDSKGPFDAIRRSWRMASGHRLKILAIAAICFWLPVTLFLAAYFLSLLRHAAAVFEGLPAMLWTISAVVVVLFSGPWFSGAITALHVPLKEEEDTFELRRENYRRTSYFR
ncbi:MAG: hypothetical protein E4H08_09965 [Candidatus Atribacteria bacterium]|nr:MAG: hypothetical protein E4H08_09965 [Candidatus Atribacteria bacterium]